MTRRDLVQAHAVGAFGDLTDSAMDLLDSAVKALRVESTYGPPIYIPRPFRQEAEDAAAAGPGAAPPTTIEGEGFDIARILKPKITFEMRSGWGRNRTFAPYGDPGPSKYGWVVAGLIATILLASYGGFSFVRDVRRKR